MNKTFWPHVVPSRPFDTSAFLDALLSPDLDPLFRRPQRLDRPSAWFGHVPFAHWLVRAARPRCLVELGTYTGVSYAAFCEAVRRERTETRCFAVDSWRGDEHSGYYADDIFDEFSRFHAPRYGRFSTLIRKDFSAARDAFRDGSIDLLHIDGLHTYEAVSRDFAEWRPKLSERAVVLLHDTNEYRADFGVWRLWAELRHERPSFEFLHSHGLGVLCFGARVPDEVLALCALTEPADIEAVRERFAFFGEHWLLEIAARSEGRQKVEEAARPAEQSSPKRLRERLASLEATNTRLTGDLAGEVAARARMAVDLADARRSCAVLIVQAEEASRRADALQAALTEARAAAEIHERQIAQSAQAQAQSVRAAEEAEQRLAEAERRAAAREEEARHLSQQLTAVLSATTWRMGAPLRRLGASLPPRWRAGLLSPAQVFSRALRPGSLSRLRKAWRLRRDVSLVRRSPLFDEAWYQVQYPDVAAAQVDPVVHYLRYGAGEGRHPGPAFNTQWYLRRYPDVAAAGLNPLVHYLRHGFSEGRQSGPPAPVQPQYGKDAPAPGGSSAAIEELQDGFLGRHQPLLAAEVAIGIVTYNSPQPELQRLVSSARVALERAGVSVPGRVFLIDNGDASGPMAEDEALVRRVPSQGNVGFGKAHNLLMREAFRSGAELYIATNPDGMFHPDAIAALVRMSRAAEGRALLEAAQFPEEHPKYYDPVTFDTPWASGACLAISRRIFETIGGFDEQFFMYCEDVDLSWRALAEGFSVKICPHALFLHAVTNRGPNIEAHRMMLRSGLVLGRKWGGDDFSLAVGSELRRMNEEPPAIAATPLPADWQRVADFSHMFHFAPARW